MLANLSKQSSREELAVIGIIGCGGLARLIWAGSGQNSKPLLSESHNVAASLALTGKFAAPFADGGPATAHVGMLTPLPAAASYWLFGVDTPLAEFVLSLWAVGLVAISFWLCWRLARALEIPAAARIAAVTFVSLVPLEFGLEMREGRSWEVNLAALLLIWILLRLVCADRKEAPRARELAVTGAIAGFLFIVSPPAGAAAVLAIGLYQFLRLPLPRWWLAPAAFILIAVPLAGFWAERNMAQLGEAIALRDNFGLELNLSDYSGAVNPADAHAAYLARMRDIHPLGFGSAIEKLRAAGGEVPYYHQMGAEARNWIVAHPMSFLYLDAKHFAQFFLPPRWFWGMFGGAGKIIWLRQILAWMTAIAGLSTLAVMTYRHRTYGYLLAATLACSAPYILVQPTLRYRYLVSTLLAFLAFDGLVRVSRCIGARKREARKLSNLRAH